MSGFDARRHGERNGAANGANGASAWERRGEQVPRFGHGSRVPGWDDAVDLTKDPAVVPDLETTPMPEELRSAVQAAMAKYPERRSAAIPALHAAQQVHGWCSPEAIHQVAAAMQVTPAYLTSVATFYDMLETTPKGSHDVYVCTNISCSLRGADDFYAAMIAAAAEDPDVNVRSFECLGACDIAPMASVDGEYVGPLNTADADQIVQDLRAGRPVLEAKQLRLRKCADPGAIAGSASGATTRPPDPGTTT
ncbi:MAG: NAD(P)H-dependent oxidoreductase subunit E [Solirubrobacteraceae bacterium]